MLLGKPRIGKSWAVYEGAKLRAERLGKKFINLVVGDGGLTEEQIIELLENPDKYFVLFELRLTNVEPTDIIGKPEDVTIKTKDGKVYKFTILNPPIWATVLSKCSGVLFLDELTDVQRPDVKAVTYQLLLDKKAGYVKFKDDVLVVAAGNTPDVSSLSGGLTLPQAGRLRIFNVRPPTVEEWQEHMDKLYGDKYDKSVLIYLQRYKHSLLKLPVEEISGGDIGNVIYKTDVFEPYPSPDSWRHLAVALYEKQHIKEGLSLDEFVSSYIGEQEGMAFKLFYEEFISVDADKLLENLPKNKNAIKKLSWNQKAALISQIASHVNEDLSALIKYKPLLDALAFEGEYVANDYIAIFSSCLRRVSSRSAKLSSDILKPFRKLISEKDYSILYDTLKLKQIPISYRSLVLYLLQAMDRRYEKGTVDLCGVIREKIIKD